MEEDSQFYSIQQTQLYISKGLLLHGEVMCFIKMYASKKVILMKAIGSLNFHFKILN